MKQIKITLEATVEVPDHVELGEDHNGIPYYMTMSELELHPALAFDDAGALTNPLDFNCEVLFISTRIEKMNA